MPRVINRSPEDIDEPQPLLLQEPEVHHVPMDLVFSKLPYLREIYINIGVISLKDDFDLRDFEFSVEDSLNIGRGTKELRYLTKFSLTRSNLNQPRAAAILQGLAVNNSLVEIDFSHCELGDQGAMAIGAFLGNRSLDGRLESLNLCNNEIGSQGVSGLVRGLILSAPKRSGIRRLNLRFNPIGDEGAGHLAALLLRFASLEYLNVSGCSFGPDGGMKMAEVLASGHTKFSNFQLDCSNNELGTIVGEAFEAVAKSCIAITEIDLRMCGFRKESENTIIESINRNRANLKQQRQTRHSSRYKSIMRGESLQPPPKFAIFQTPQKYGLTEINVVDDEDNENEESSELNMENEEEL